ncbi:CDP-diacylglycerol--glycerol-3-phosphate 3-phosphatidyltransferase [Candidatus Binatia bacterium]|jgi:CDP-diacylglycerol--glycerol-3-phosphate 3-phosphatidyltransferase|nr:CDP-diacylglycerol--glycerol-3-phosphate 3-phosphatidyltransferase [Candidatus Binatia bacterium]
MNAAGEPATAPTSDAARRPNALNLPNVISLSRVAITPLLIWLLTDPGREASRLAALAFFVACVSDWLDGYLARRRGLITNLGKFLDPLADKVLIISALIMLTAMPREPRVPGWIVAVIAAREVAVTGLRAIARDEGIVLGAESLGKAKMTFEIVALFSLLMHYPVWLIDFHAAGMVFVWIALVLALWSGIAYHLRLARVIYQRS